MTTAELLAIIEPHKELLKGMGWEVEPIDKLDNFVFLPLGEEDVDAIPVAFAARILADVCMEALDGWARGNGCVVDSREGPSDVYVYSFSSCSADGEWYDIADSGPPSPRLAALLALLAWTKGQA